MKENLFPTPESGEFVETAKDVDADDPEASDLLDVIGRDTSEEEQPEAYSCWSHSTFAPSANVPS